MVSRLRTVIGLNDHVNFAPPVVIVLERSPNDFKRRLASKKRRNGARTWKMHEPIAPSTYKSKTRNGFRLHAKTPAT